MTAGPASARRKPRQIDWHRAAEMLAEGVPVAAVAREIGCSRSGLSRRRNRDRIFKDLIEHLRAARAEDPDRRVAELKRSLHAAMVKEIGKGNARIILWLAERLNLVPAAGERPSDEELRGVLGSLSAEELREFESLRDPV